MFIKKKRLLATSLVILTTANFSMANDAVSSDAVIADTVKEKAAEGSLKLVMRGLLKDTQQLTAAMLNEDFTLIAAKAKIIADHPKPSMATRKKIMKTLGADMAKFKANDDVVHNAAVEIVTNAEQKNINGVGENFKKMIGGCLSCHSTFKNRVSEILK
ncbi:cytochrome c [Candidatus Colwellia aromaticivorans]|uniref:cytochrome c n=1 Tax=Candidatus Colwellia aromaticivorans TaxID=2267621 RepID=UPI000DF4725D|nr:cytochrome c [Candidatus Colwellia aromaticivorans]